MRALSFRRSSAGSASALQVSCRHFSRPLTVGGVRGSNDPSARAPSRSRAPFYYNFKTLHQHPHPSAASSMESTRVDVGAAPPQRGPRRLSSSHTLADDQLPLENTLPRNSSDTYEEGPRIFRRDMVDAHGGKHFSLSVDVPMKKFIDMFCDFDGKRCKLCNETFLQWHSHTGAIPHAGREGLMLEMVRAYCGTPDEIVRRWWRRLDTSKTFRRLPALSHENSHIRKRRLQFILRFLKDRQILRDTFSVTQSAAAGAGRTWAFERLEWVGDNVVKYLFNNRLNCVFPVSEGGIRGKLGYSQFMIDGNNGLARSYDYLELQQLTQNDRVVSKFKSDVVETLFGELQLYLWATEVDAGTEAYAMPFTKDMYSVRALVAHAMEELGHVMFMYHAEYLQGCLQRIVRENQLQFVRADPALRSHAAELSMNDHAASVYAKKAHAVAANTQLSPTRLAHSHQGGSDSSLFMESVNYDGFKRVAPLGGLLPRPFALSALAVTPAYMPHLQVAQALTRAVQQNGVDIDLKGEDEAALQVSREEESAYSLSAAPAVAQEKAPTTPSKLGVAELKDEDLITELL